MSTTSNAPFSEIPPFVVSLFAGSKDQPVTGTQLRQLIKFKFPDFTPTRYGCRNLRDFLHQYVPDVEEKSRSGMDYVYGLRGSAAALSEPVEAVDGDSSPAEPVRAASVPSSDAAIWRTFASPRTQFRLYGDPETGMLAVVSPGGRPPSESWREVPPCTAEKHIEIAKGFIAQLGEGLTSQLTIQFDRPNWWLTFYEELKRLGLAGRWNTFRRERILDELRATLGNLGVPIDKVPSSAAVWNSVRPSAGAPNPKNARAMVVDGDTSRLRQLAAAIVKNMSARELRELPVRLGDVVDALDL